MTKEKADLYDVHAILQPMGGFADLSERDDEKPNEEGLEVL